MEISWAYVEESSQSYLKLFQAFKIVLFLVREVLLKMIEQLL